MNVIFGSIDEEPEADVELAIISLFKVAAEARGEE